MAAIQQHFLRPEACAGLMGHVDLHGVDVVEFGAGTGSLTRMLLDAGAASVEAWELDPGLPAPFDDGRLAWRTADILEATREDLRGRAVAAFPPYLCLGFLLALCRHVDDLLLMVPPRHDAACRAMGMRRLAVLDGAAFDPPSGGRHLIVGRGRFAPPARSASKTTP